MFEQDYIMRQIRQIIEVAMKMFFNVNVVTPQTMTIQNKDKQAKSDELIRQIEDSNIRDAIADFKSATNGITRDDLLIGFNFFAKLCQSDDDILEKNNITYSEIQDEMRIFFAQYGITDRLFDLIFME